MPFRVVKEEVLPAPEDGGGEEAVRSRPSSCSACHNSIHFFPDIHMSPQHVPVIVRSATEADLEGVDELVRQFVHGHPAETHPRPLSRLREAYFGPSPVAHLLVACKGSRVIGMGQWTRIYDMFWAMFAGRVEWLFVVPELRGHGIAAAIIAEICHQVRAAGGEFLQEQPAVRTSPRCTRAPRSEHLATDSICPPRHSMLSRTLRGFVRVRSYGACPAQNSTK